MTVDLCHANKQRRIPLRIHADTHAVGEADFAGGVGQAVEFDPPVQPTGFEDCLLDADAGDFDGRACVPRLNRDVPRCRLAQPQIDTADVAGRDRFPCQTGARLRADSTIEIPVVE